MPKPLEVMDAKQLENFVLAYAPAMDPNELKNMVSIALSIAKTSGVMIVKADPDDFRLHLRYLRQITWTP